MAPGRDGQCSGDPGDLALRVDGDRGGALPVEEAVLEVVAGGELLELVLDGVGDLVGELGLDRIDDEVRLDE